MYYNYTEEEILGLASSIIGVDSAVERIKVVDVEGKKSVVIPVDLKSERKVRKGLLKQLREDYRSRGIPVFIAEGRVKTLPDLADSARLIVTGGKLTLVISKSAKDSANKGKGIKRKRLSKLCKDLEELGLHVLLES